MKAVILCAGEGERLKPLTEITPKPLILINNKPILSYILDSLPNEINEVFIIIQKRHSDLFGDFLKTINSNIKINLLYQDINKKGTYFALMTAKEYLMDEDKFLVLNGDDIFLKDDLEKLIKIPAPTYGLSYKKLNKRYRTCDLDEINNKIISFRKQKESEEGKELPCFSGAFTLTKDFFSYSPVYYDGSEAGIPHTLFENRKDVSYLILKEWLQINTIEDLDNAKIFFEK
jgi:NDP-sugar pyrophosphorylase family protein